MNKKRKQKIIKVKSSIFSLNNRYSKIKKKKQKKKHLKKH